VRPHVLFLFTGLNLLDYLDRYLVGALGTPIARELGLSGGEFGFLGTAFLLVYFLTSPVFGYLGDRYGRLGLMAAGAVLWSLATSLTFWVTSYAGLLLARGLVGVGEASFGTLAPAYLGDVLPLERRSRALGWFYLAIPLGFALAHLAAGLLVQKWGWRPVFLLAGLPGLALAGGLFLLPGPGAPAPEALPPAPGRALRRLWAIPTLRLVTLGYGMLTFTLGGLAHWLTRFLVEEKGLAQTEANYLLFAAIAVAGTAGTVVGGCLGSGWQRRLPASPLWVSGLGLVAAWPLALVVIVSAVAAFYLPCLMVAIFLLFLHPGVLTAVIVSVAPPALRAQAVALNIVIIHLIGDAPSSLLIGWVADHLNLTWGVGLTLVSLLLAAVCILAAIPRLPRDLVQPLATK
jgi:MFS family permease